MELQEEIFIAQVIERADLEGELMVVVSPFRKVSPNPLVRAKTWQILGDKVRAEFISSDREKIVQLGDDYRKNAQNGHDSEKS